MGKLGYREALRAFAVELVTWGDADTPAFRDVLRKHDIAWTTSSLQAVAAETLTPELAVALLQAVAATDRYTDGVLSTFAQSGHIDTWLACLKGIDDAVPESPPVREVIDVKIRMQSIIDGSLAELDVSREHIRLTNTLITGASSHQGFDLGGRNYVLSMGLMHLADCLAAEGWQEIDRAGETANLFEIHATCDDDTVIHRTGLFDRANMPEREFRAFIDAVRTTIESFGNGSILDLSGFTRAVRPGEIKYCGVDFSRGGKLYHYYTKDFSIEVGDVVFVPVGADNDEKRATVRSVEFPQWDDTPYPLEHTKEIVRRLTPAMAPRWVHLENIVVGGHSVPLPPRQD